jgi:hypothetical protein
LTPSKSEELVLSALALTEEEFPDAPASAVPFTSVAFVEFVEFAARRVELSSASSVLLGKTAVTLQHTLLLM